MLDTEDRPIPGLFAAGELVGGLFYHNYAGGTGLMAGSVFGKTAGEESIRADPPVCGVARRTLAVGGLVEPGQDGLEGALPAVLEHQHVVWPAASR